MTDLNQLFISYKSYIKSKYPERLRVFRAIEKNNPASARAEAVVHSLLASNDADVTNKSNIPDEDPHEIKAHLFSYITSLLQRKARAKVEQLADEPHPRILAICSEHIANNVLLSKFAAKELMTGDTKIKVELNRPSAPHKNITELEFRQYCWFK